jgi:hypothetical protein
MVEIINSLSDEVINPVLSYPGVKDLIAVDEIDNPALKKAFQKRFLQL